MRWEFRYPNTRKEKISSGAPELTKSGFEPQGEEKNSRALSRRRVLAAALGSLVGAGCGKEKEPRGGKGETREAPGAEFRLGRPNVVLLVLDTMRADHLECAGAFRGSARDFTPNLDRLARSAVRFTNAFANAPWTLPSHGSLFTGREPQEHKQTHEAVLVGGKRIRLKTEAHLPGRFTTLASALRALGYQTLGISQNPWVGRLTTQDHGFGLFWELWAPDRLPFPPRKGKDLSLHKVSYAFRHFLEKKRDPARPFFLFVNYITCHLPYRPAWKFRRKFVPGFPPDYLLDMTSHNWLPLKEEGSWRLKRSGTCATSISPKWRKSTPRWES